MSGNLTPTPIVDKNGKQTTVHKKAPEIPGSARVAAAQTPAAVYETINREESGGVIDGGDAIFRGEHVQVRLTYMGEGYNGDYDNDGEDMPLARAEVYVKPGLIEGSSPSGDDEWELTPSTHSYCTLVPANIELEELEDWVNENGNLLDGKISDDLSSGDDEKIARDITAFLNFASYSNPSGRIESFAW